MRYRRAIDKRGLRIVHDHGESVEECLDGHLSFEGRGFQSKQSDEVTRLLYACCHRGWLLSTGEVPTGSLDEMVLPLTFKDVRRLRGSCLTWAFAGEAALLSTTWTGSKSSHAHTLTAETCTFPFTDRIFPRAHHVPSPRALLSQFSRGIVPPSPSDASQSNSTDNFYAPVGRSPSSKLALAPQSIGFMACRVN